MQGPDRPTESPRERRRRARVDAILDAAMQIVLEEGAHLLTMRDLASALELSPGAVYRYFDGKDAIIAALGHRTLSGYAERLHAREEDARVRSAGAPEAPRALYLLLARVQAYWDVSVQDPGGWRLLNLLLVDPRRLITGAAHGRFMASVAVQIQRLAALAQGAVAAGALGPGDGAERALIIIAALNGNLQYLKMAETSPVPLDPARTMRASLDAVLRGWGAAPEALRAAWGLLDADARRSDGEE